MSESVSLLPIDLERRKIVPVGFADEVLELALGRDEPAVIWDDATTLAGAVAKWSSLGYETTELEAAWRFLEIALSDKLGPRPGVQAGPGRGNENNPHTDRFLDDRIPPQRRTEFRAMHGYRDRLIEYVREVRAEKNRVPSRRQLLVLVDRWSRPTNGTADREPGTLPMTISLRVADARALPLDDESVDLVVTSPPYGLDVDYAGASDVPADAWPRFMRDWLTEAFRVTKPSGRLALNVPLDTSEPTYRPTYVQATLAALAAGWQYAATIVWTDNQTKKGGWALGSQASSARPRHVSQCEMILLASKGDWAPSSERPDDITPAQFLEAGRGPWTFSGESQSWDGHPAAFPLELPRRLIRYLCRVGDVVLDPFVGSGTTALAAAELGRCVYGFDASAAYVESARGRLLESPS